MTYLFIAGIKTGTDLLDPEEVVVLPDIVIKLTPVQRQGELRGGLVNDSISLITES